MIERQKIVSVLMKTVERLKDTKYATCDIEERLALARMEVANLRAALLDVCDAESADICAKKLRSAEDEYRRILRISRQRRAV